MNTENIETVEMRCALSAIAQEMQKFHNMSICSDNIVKSEDMLGALLQYKTTLKLKKARIKILQQNLRAACAVAKTLSAAKASEMAVLHNEINHIKNQYWDLEQQQKQKTYIISTLQAENQTLHNNLQCFNNFIKLGYKELQHVCNEPIENISTLKQLQKIIFYCGQYCADRANQVEKCAQLEQKNRFMNSKLCILESQLQITSNELQNLRNIHRTKLQNELTLTIPIPIFAKNGLVQTNVPGTKASYQPVKSNTKYLDLSRHLSSVKTLLRNQDTLIKDLNCLSKKLNVEAFLE